MTNCLSDGKLGQMTLDTEISDIKAVTEYARSLSIVDTEKMVLVGHSQGGLVASLAAADKELKDQFCGLMLLAPGFEMIETNASKYKDGTIPVPNKVSLSMIGTMVNKEYIFSLLAHYDIYEEISAFTKPVKIYLGTSDGLFTESAMQAAIAAYGKNASYEMVEGGAHDFLPRILETLVPQSIIPFLNSVTA